MNINIKLNTDNSAFEDYYELERILKTAIDKINGGFSQSFLRDINGNVVGELTVKNTSYKDKY